MMILSCFFVKVAKLIFYCILALATVCCTGSADPLQGVFCIYERYCLRTSGSWAPLLIAQTIHENSGEPTFSTGQIFTAAVGDAAPAAGPFLQQQLSQCMPKPFQAQLIPVQDGVVGTGTGTVHLNGNKTAAEPTINVSASAIFSRQSIRDADADDTEQKVLTIIRRMNKSLPKNETGKQRCRSRCFQLEPEQGFSPGSGFRTWVLVYYVTVLARKMCHQHEQS